MDQEQAYAELVELTELGNRFHGGDGMARAADWLVSRLEGAGLRPDRMPVTLPGWAPGNGSSVAVTQPWTQDIVSWPMLWSAGTDGPVEGRVVHLGDQGLWGDSQLWRRLALVDDEGDVLAFLHVRDKGPAAPQPLPSGSDPDIAHVSISQDDGERLIGLIRGGVEVRARVNSGCSRTDEATSDNIVVTIPGTGTGRALVCAHYDAFWNTPGAYDNGSGTIALLSLAISLAEAPVARTIDIVFTTGEEWHLGGSRRYVELSTEEELLALDFVLNIDGLGGGDLVELASGPEAFEQQFYAHVARRVERTRAETTVHTRFPPTKGTDDASFAAKGVPTAFITFNNWHKLHQPDDVPTREIARNIAWVADAAPELLASLPRPDRLGSVDFL